MKLKSRKIISMALVFFMMLTILPMAPVTAHAATNENINTIVIGSHTISALNETDSGTGWTYDGTGTKPVITLTDYNGSGIYIEGNDTATQVGVVINVVGDCNITTNSNGVQLNAAAADSSSLEFQFANNAQLTIKGNIGILHQSENPVTYFVGSGTCNVIAYTSYGLSSTAIATHYNTCYGSIVVSNTKLRVTSPEAVKTGWTRVDGEGQRAHLTVSGTADVKFDMTGSAAESVLFGHELINPEGFVKNVSSDKKTFELYKYVPQATVTFDANGGTGTMEPVQVPVESLYNPNGNVECGFEAPPHKMFAGWASIEGSNHAISTPITIPSEGKTFYAIWIDDPDEVKVMSFDANGGTGTMEPVQVYVGDDYTPPVTCAFAAPDGMKFVGWSYVLNGPVKTDPITVTEDKTFYAVWEPLIDKIDKIDITGLEAPVAGTAPGTPAPTFTPAEKFTVVAEWLTGGSGGIAGNFKEDTDYIAFFILTPNEGEAFADGITTSDVTVDKGEVSDVGVAENNGIYIKVKIKSVAGEGGETPVCNHENMTLVEKEKAIHTQEKLKNGMEAHYYCADCEKYFDTDKNETTKDALTIEAKHTAGTAVKENEVTATCKKAGSYDEVVKCSECGKELSRNTVTGTTDATNHEGTAKWTKTAETHAKAYTCCEAVVVAEEPHEYDNNQDTTCNECGYERTIATVTCIIKFNSDGGSEVEPSVQNINLGGLVNKPAAPTKEGFTFKGWFLDDTEYDFAKPVEKGFTLTAKWEAKEVVPPCEHENLILKYEDETGHWSECTVEGCEYKTEKVSHVFDNDADKDCACGYEREIVKKYTITYTDGVDGKVIFTDKVFENVVDGSDTPAFGAAPTRSGYTFKGWSPAVAEKVTGNQTYTATWQKRSSGGSYGGGSYVAPDKDADNKLRIVMQINNKNILVNGKTMVNDVAPVIVGDRTLVPIRVVTELLGGSADWDNATRTVTLKIDGKTMNMTIGKEIPGFGTSAVIMNDRTYVPVRYVMEKLGAEVEWIGATRQIIIEK